MEKTVAQALRRRYFMGIKRSASALLLEKRSHKTDTGEDEMIEAIHANGQTVRPRIVFDGTSSFRQWLLSKGSKE
jgi:hypothetical protein